MSNYPGRSCATSGLRIKFIVNNSFGNSINNTEFHNYA